MTATAPVKQQFVTAPIKMRLGKAEDFKIEYTDFSGQKPQLKYKRKLGQPYWLRSLETGEFDNRNYQITEDMDMDEFADYLNRNMVYVPAGVFELKDAKP